MAACVLQLLLGRLLHLLSFSYLFTGKKLPSLLLHFFRICTSRKQSSRMPTQSCEMRLRMRLEMVCHRGFAPGISILLHVYPPSICDERSGSLYSPFSLVCIKRNCFKSSRFIFEYRPNSLTVVTLWGKSFACVALKRVSLSV